METNSLEEQGKLDAETDAIILYMDREQKKSWIKFGAVLILVLTAAAIILYATAGVTSMMGN